MCQRKEDGGRCSAHQPGYLGLKKFLASTYDLDEGQIKHVYTYLRTKGKSQPSPTVREYEELVERQKAHISNSDLDAKTKSQVFRQLDKKLSKNQLPDGPTFYALKRLPATAKATDQRIQQALGKFSRERGMPLNEVKEMFQQELGGIVSPPREAVRSTLDTRSRLALAQLHREHPKKWEGRPRIQREPMNRRCAITESGYDPEDGRLEVVIADQEYAYRNVSESDWEEFQRAPMRVFQRIRNDDDKKYGSPREARLDKQRLWCESCKDYKLASGHKCSLSESYETSYSNVTRALERKARFTKNEEVGAPDWHKPWMKRQVKRLGQNPDPEEVRDLAMTTGDVGSFTLTAKVQEGYTVTGGFAAGRATPNMVTMELTSAKCDCPAYRRNHECEHTREARRQFFDYYKHVDKDAAFNNPTMSFPEDAYLYRGRVPFNVDERGLTDQMKKDIYYVVSTNSREAVLYLTEKGGSDITGALNVSLQSGGLRIHSQSMCGICHRSDCHHIEGLAERYRDDIEDAVFTPSLRLEQLAKIEENQFTFPQTETATRSNSLQYTEDLEQYVQDFREAEERISRGEPAITFREEPVTNGRLSSVEGEGRGFGLELEYVVDDEAAAERIRDELAEALMKEGLSRTNDTYFHGTSSMFTEYADWAVEEDDSVSGEIISPILYDNETSWKQVAKVCEIIKKHGGKVNTECGQHVHIGASRSRVARANVMGIVKEHQDALRRAGTNMDRKRHRNNHYSLPQDDRNMQSLSYVMHGNSDPFFAMEVWEERNRTVNLSNANTVEFRDPDGTLDAAHIQAQVMLAAAVVHKAESETTFRERRGNPVGLNRKRTQLLNRGNFRPLSNDELIVSDVDYRHMLDSLFDDDASKKTMLGIAAVNPWQEGVE